MKQLSARVFCIGLHADLASGNDLSAFSKWIESALSPVRAHYQEVAHRLLVFPEYCTLPLVHDLQSLRQFGAVSFDYFPKVAIQEKAYVLTCGPYLVGSAAFNQASLYDPLGKEILRVRKQHLTEEEQAIGLTSTNEEPQSIDLPFGRVGVAICLDAFSVSYRKKLSDQGVTMLLMPSANPQTWAAPAEGSRVWQPLEWAEATIGAVSGESSITWLINPMLRGGTQFGQQFDGQSSIVRRSDTLHTCPYIGVKEQYPAEFLSCGPDAADPDHFVGFADIQ